MKSLFLFLLLVFNAALLQAAEPQLRSRINSDEIIHGGNVQANKAAADTILLMGPWGSGALHNGQFETPSGTPAWNGWTSIDYTAPSPSSPWQVSDYNAANLNGHGPGNQAAWCGSIDFPACSEEDTLGGYGNSWNETLVWTGQVADPAQPCVVSFDAWLNHDTEPGFDNCYLTLLRRNQDPLDVWVVDGAQQNLPLLLEFTCAPEDYLGENQNEVILQLRFTSDGGWSDEGCQFPTRGAVQIDDITITLSNGAVSTFDDFETDLGHWQPYIQSGVGDYAKIWTGLGDLDPCATNTTPQVAFIDDGLVVPGTGGTSCIEWCYGPGGYIVNNTGGLAGPLSHLNSAILSPVIPWPGDDHPGCILEFDVYRHELLLADSPGIGDVWMVRSTASVDPADIELASWMDRDSGVRNGGPYYLRQILGVSDLLEPGCRYIQMRLGAWQYGWIFGYDGLNGSPAPYLDNVRILAYEFFGPSVSCRGRARASDNFPASGHLDLDDLGSNSVRFDAIQDVAWVDDATRVDPGDSIFCEIAVVRNGAELEGTPRLHYKLHPNPVFDPFRTSGLPPEGWVEGWRPLGNNGEPNAYGFAFDLPDTGFFYPGDVIHYFIAATDAIGGAQVQTNRVPADTTGFGDFSGLVTYDPLFTVRALPSVRPAEANPETFIVPEILFWNRFAGQSSLSQWKQALAGLGLHRGNDFDIYSSGDPDNTLASRATLDQVSSYGTLVFSCGNEDGLVLGNQNLLNDMADDVTLLDQWLRLGGKSALLTGNHLAGFLSSSEGSPQFLTEWLAVAWQQDDVRPLIGNPFAPLVLAEPGNVVIASSESWNILTDCPRIGPPGSDAVIPLPGAQRLAQFADPAGLPEAYAYAAATLWEVPEFTATVISLPYDLMYVRDASSGSRSPAPLAARALLLGDVLAYFGVPFSPDDLTDVPGLSSLTVSSYPNPFNPRIRINFNLPQAGNVALKIFNVKGELVQTLLDEQRPAGAGEATWDGSDGQGAAVSSGLYFYELRAHHKVKVGKMTLVR